MADPTHHSIGEVLSLLKDDHPDVTISKIRFLESQGLIDPERTPSGYRKFYAADIERLEWILTQQRDNFLPLKVIKRRLEEAGFDTAKASTAPDGPLPEPTLFARRDEADAEGTDPAPESTEPAEPGPDTESGGDAAPVPVAPVAATETAGTDEVAAPAAEPVEEPSATTDASTPTKRKPRRTKKSAKNDDGPLAAPSGSVSLQAAELAATADAAPELIAELEKLGLIVSTPGSPGPSYDEEALVVVKAAAELVGHGLEPRHLRMFKVAAEREAGLFAQLTSTGMTRGGDARTKARAELNELARLGETIHRSVLRRSLGAGDR